MKKSILIPTVLIAGLSLAAVSTYAATSTSSRENTHMNQKSFFGNMKMDHDGDKMGRGGPMMDLTDAEKTALQSMSETERKGFFEKKRTEMEAKMTARDAVIDKLLAGTALTSEEETLRQTMIKERAEMKAKRAEMQAQMEKVKAVMAKKEAGQTLTTEEQALLDNMPKHGEGKGHGFGQRARSLLSK